MQRILIVDDSRFIYEEMKRMLDSSEFEIVGYAKSGEELLDIYGEIKPDIVTLDIILPGIDGLEAAEKLFQKHPDAKIIIVSSLDYDDTEEEALAIGISDFIFKPIEKSMLLERLRKVGGI